MIESAFDLGPHAAFIWSAYAVTAVCILGLTIGVVGADRRQRRLLADLEARGITRRSAAKPTEDTAPAKVAEKATEKPVEKPAAKRQAKTGSQAKSQSQAKPRSSRSRRSAAKAQTAKQTKRRGAK